MRYNYALSSIDDESPVFGHLGEFADKYNLLFEFPGITVSESSPDKNGRGITYLVSFTFGNGIFGSRI